MMLAGSAVSAAGTLFGGISANKASKEAAAAMEMQAQLRIQQGEYDAEQERRRYVRAAGTTQANAAASGIDIQSFADVFADDASESALAQKTIRWGAQRDAANMRAQASDMRTKGKNNLIGSIGAAVGSVFSSAGRYRSASSPSVGAWSTSVSYGA
jgi:hypothetical protein